MNCSMQLAEFAANLNYENIPEIIRDDVKSRILDFFASAAAGHNVNKATDDIILDVVMNFEGKFQSSLLFVNRKVTAPQAAFYNAFVGNGADMDDGHMLANGHPGVCVIPAVLAVAQWRGIGWEDIAAAIVAGYETFIRISSAMNPSHLDRGFNSTGTNGAIAAAVAVSRALKLNKSQIHAAMGLAATSGSGLMELNESGQAMKPINPGKSSYIGVMCSLFAEHGAVGPVAPLDGKKGYFKAFADEVHTETMLEGLGEKFVSDTAYIKLYPGCRHVHAMADCGAMLMVKLDGRYQDIDRIVLYTYPASEKLTGSITYPANQSEAKFSLTYAAAVSMLTGNFTLYDLYTAAELSDDIRNLIDRMTIVVCPELEDRKNMIRGAKMEVVMADGEKFEALVEVPKGEKKFPLEKDDLKKKLNACARGLISDENQEKLYKDVMNWNEKTSIDEIFKNTYNGLE